MFIHTVCNILISNRKTEILKLTGMLMLSYFSEERSQEILCAPGIYVLRGFIFDLIFTIGDLDCDFRIESYPFSIANRHLKQQTYSLTTAT